jgi:hypothetical protein
MLRAVAEDIAPRLPYRTAATMARYKQAVALRALADRIDAEAEALACNEVMDELRGLGMVNHGMRSLLSRIDADPSAGQEGAKRREGMEPKSDVAAAVPLKEPTCGKCRAGYVYRDGDNFNGVRCECNPEVTR